MEDGILDEIRASFSLDDAHNGNGPRTDKEEDEGGCEHGRLHLPPHSLGRQRVHVQDEVEADRHTRHVCAENEMISHGRAIQ